MRIALVNPPWRFDGSIYFGCHEPHLPLELACAKWAVEREGHSASIIDAHLLGLTAAQTRDAVRDFRADLAVIVTAPTYLFWRCPPPELRIPLQMAEILRDSVAILVAVGPHGSTTPRAVLQKLPVDIVVMGECEETLAQIACAGFGNRVLKREIPGTCYYQNGRTNDAIRVVGGPRATIFKDLPPLQWPAQWLRRHRHHHHRFDTAPIGPGAEVEASRGCPFHCSFCAKENFRDRYRRRPHDVILREIDGLRAQGVAYIYFIDEIFLPNRPLLEGLAERQIPFGVQTRLDLWSAEMIALLGKAGCVSIEAGVESLTEAGRDALDKQCRIDTEELTRRLLLARQVVPFVQANLIQVEQDDPAAIASWRTRMRDAGIWANDPVPLFPYPGSPDYRKRWGVPDDHAWERAHQHYLSSYASFSDIQSDQPLPLSVLERSQL